MERYIGLDVHAQSCTLAVVSAAGKRLGLQVVETNGTAVKQAISVIAGNRHICLEEGTQICGGHRYVAAGGARLPSAAIWRVPPPHRIQVLSSRRSTASFGRKRGPCLADTPARSRPRRIISTSASA